MKTAVQIIAACQSIIARFLPPDGIREDFALGELVKILDSPEAVALTMPQQPGLESALSPDQLIRVSGAQELVQTAEVSERLAHRRLIAKMLTASEQPAEAQVTIARLREELERRRAAENHLIAERDRLIHHDISTLRLELAHAEGALKASQDRERRLTERLAAIASLTSDH